MTDSKKLAPSRKAAALFAAVALAWLVFDRLTKVYFESAYVLGQTSPADYLLFRFRLVHNTGAAWGMFGDSTLMLGVTSVIVCVLVATLFLFFDRIAGHAPMPFETLGMAFVFSGGLGNAIDRFMQGYVVDFIDFTFMNFPVFNIADIGVTCGFVFVAVGYWLATRHQGQAASVVDGGEAVSCKAVCAQGAQGERDNMADRIQAEEGREPASSNVAEGKRHD